MLFDNQINGDPVNDPDFNPSDPDHAPRNYWAAHDANYDVQGLVDSSGTLVERYTYTPYGQRRVFFSPGSNDPDCYAATLMSCRVTLSGTPSVTAPYGLNPFGHQGLHHDEESRLIYNRARMYEPRIGRFMQRDPAGIQYSRFAVGKQRHGQVTQLSPAKQYGDGLNLYQYVDNDPVRLHDAKGLCPCGTCDTWYITIFSIQAGGDVAVGITVNAFLEADLTVCPNIKPAYTFANGDQATQYIYVGGGLGEGIHFSWSIGGSRRIFRTPCIKWKDHIGFGRITSVGVGLIITYSHVYVTTPQTYQHLGGFSFGIDASLLTSVGHWSFVR